jgi:predicted DCC family thiol-disulfide oxidoreductase YuxK
MEVKNNNILLFDGVCNLCNGFVQFTIKRDTQSKFKFASLQSKSGQYLLKENNLPIENFTSLVYIKGGHYFFKSSAVLHFLKDLGGVWIFFFILIIIPRPVRDFVYTITANSRYRVFGRRESCLLPTPEFKNRFLE